MASEHQHISSSGANKHYKAFFVMVGLSFIAMYILMYAMVDSFASVYNNVNQVYMAGLMAAPMAIIEIAVMSAMYPNKRRNILILVVSLLALIGFFMGIRQQVGVDDKQFLRSMIPHHSGAILMCAEAKLENPVLKDLCKTIIESQKAEIDQMKSLLQEMDK